MTKAAAFALICLIATKAVAAPSLIPRAVEQTIQGRIKAGQYPSIVIAVVKGNRSEIYTYGKLNGDRLPTASTVYEIGSVTKTFTATLLADAVIKHQIRLEEPLANLLPEFSIPSKDGHAITLASIAHQNSGLPRLPTNLKPINPNDPYADYDAVKLKSFLASYALPRTPGTRYEYSNLAVGLLGYALGHYAGSSYPVLLNATIFTPLGMHNTSVAMGDDKLNTMTVGHDAAGAPEPDWHFDALAAAGGIRSTGDDMLRYLKANMGKLSSPLLAAMRLAQTPAAPTSVPGNEIGLIWVTRHRNAGQDVIWHNGLTAGFASFIGFTADRQRGVVVLANQQAPVDDLGFATLWPDWPLAPSHRSIGLPAAELDAYQGAYQLSPTMVVRIVRSSDHLQVQATHQGPFLLYPWAANEFFNRVLGITVSFNRSKQGRVEALILHQGGQHLAPRISADQAASIEGVQQTSLDGNVLQDYVGHYVVDAKKTFLVTLDDGQLMVKFADQPFLPLYARRMDEFSYQIVPAQIEFKRDQSGAVRALVLHQNGAELHAARVSD